MRRIALVAAILFLIASAVGPVIAQPLQISTSECDQIVLDQANAFGGKLGQVEAEAQKLVALGAEVRIRTFQSVPSGNLETYEKTIEGQCKSWQNQEGGRKSTLFALMVSVNDRKMVTYYGDQWKPSLDPNNKWLSVQTDFMNPRFRDGDYGAGFVNGIKEYGRLMDLQMHPPAAPAQQQPQVVVVQQESKPPSAPLDLSGLWAVLKLIVILGILALAVYVIAKALSSYLVQQSKQRGSRQAARIAKQEIASRMGTWEDNFKRVKLIIDVLKGQISASDSQPLEDLLSRGRGTVDRISVDYAGLEETVGNPDRDGLSAEEYDESAERYQGLLERMTDAEGWLRQAEQGASTLEETVKQAPKALKAVEEDLAAAQAEVDKIAQTGFITGTSNQTLEAGKQLLGQANTNLQNKEFKKALSVAGQAAAKAKEAVTSARVLQQQKKDMDTQIEALRARISAMPGKIAEARQAFQRISGIYAESTWTAIKGNGTEAEKRLASGTRALENAEKFASMDTQNWEEADASVKVGNLVLEEGESYLRSIMALNKNLEEAKVSIPGQLTDLRADIQRAAEYIQRYDQDIRESLEADLARANGKIEAVQGQLTEDKPDYIQASKLLRTIHDGVDEILATARTEHETIVRLSQKAATATQAASREISKAAEYIEDHSSDVKHTAKELLEDAQGSLTIAESEVTKSSAVEDLDRKNHLERACAAAEDAESDAESAYSKAKSDFDDAEEARQPVYVPVSYPSTYHSSPTYSSSPSHHDSGGGGGGSSWGSSGGGGGGSSFGGGGGGGGGGGSSW